MEFKITEADVGRKVRMRNGKQAEVFKVDEFTTCYPVEAHWTNDAGQRSEGLFTENGSYIDDETDDEYDLVEFIDDTDDEIDNEHGLVEFIDDTEETTHDNVNKPKHYSLFTFEDGESLQAIEVIASSMTVEQFSGYCLGNALKYRLRCGRKDNIEQEISKAEKYQELYDEYVCYCKGYSDGLESW